ncbi:hypothetical protein ASH01_12950 [Terrabacter sp. Soil811]|uniref:hypothetical protein n=1 Tax=Terrabacter sp. Soil811 TaxID=1736419 RepID=UPI0006FEF89B|nr:hypothetical protein [Terrabacter sp. Soil811]KRF44860.1 hypothetical protein ASH01_12950 [Terrabacter sp. Soil811]
MNLQGRLRRLIPHPSDDSGSEAEVALDMAKYKYLLRVSTPQVFDLVHAEVFAQLPVATREAVYRRLCRDVPEEHRPTSADPEELARAAARAQDDDPVYLLRVLRRPGGAPGSAPEPAGKHRADTTTYGASVLEAAARTAAASPAAAEALLGFDTSLEAAQINPTHSVPRLTGGDHSAPRADWQP